MDDSAGPEPQAGPCLLPDHLLVQKLLRYDQRRWDLVDAARKALACDLPLEALARVPIEHPAVGTPPVHRAMLEVRKGRRDGLSVSSLKRVRHEERRGWQHSPARHEFDEAFDRFVTEWVLPQFGCDILVSPATLRVVLPGGTRPSRPHCDADYRYDASEVNFWVPLTHVYGTNSIWVESAPDRADFSPVHALPGHVLRFYGNRCRHFTLENDVSAPVRVTFDFRVLPRHLASAALPADVATLASEFRYKLHVWGGAQGRGTTLGGEETSGPARASSVAAEPLATPPAKGAGVVAAAEAKAAVVAEAEAEAAGRLVATVQALVELAGRDVFPASHAALLRERKECVRPSDGAASGADLVCHAPCTLWRVLRAEQRRGGACSDTVRVSTVSEYGVSRDRVYSSAAEVGEALVAALPDEARAKVADCRVQPDGSVRLTTRAHMCRLRAVGLAHCTACGGFFAGMRGLRNHWAFKHGRPYEAARASAEAACTALVEYAGLDTDGDTLYRAFVARADAAASESELPPALAAARDGDVGLIRKMLSAGWDPRGETDRHGSSALIWAASGGHLELCELLHAHRAAVTYRQPQSAKGRFGGRTALHWAARNGHLRVCRWLVQRGADPNALTSDGTPPLHWAVWQARSDVCAWLVDEAGASLHATNSFGCNAIQWAAQSPSSEALAVCRWLHTRGLDVGIVNRNGHSALHKAAIKGAAEVCEWLLREGGLGAAHMRADRDGNTPSSMARAEGFAELGRALEAAECAAGLAAEGAREK